MLVDIIVGTTYSIAGRNNSVPSFRIMHSCEKQSELSPRKGYLHWKPLSYNKFLERDSYLKLLKKITSSRLCHYLNQYNLQSIIYRFLTVFSFTS